MNKKVLIGLIILIILIGLIIVLSQNIQIEKENEIEPEEEISDVDMRKTMVVLYYKNVETNELEQETRLIDVKQLINEPYIILFNLLKETPQNTKLVSVIPEGTEVNGVQLEQDTLYLDLSKEFIQNHKGGEIEESLTIYSIVNTLTELTEINSVKILIDGQENMRFQDGKIGFSEAFVRK